MACGRLIAALSLAALTAGFIVPALAAEPATAPTWDDRVLKVWQSLNVDQTDAEQRQLIDPLFATMKESGEKMALLQFASPGEYGPQAVDPAVMVPYAIQLLHDSDTKVQAAALQAIGWCADVDISESDIAVIRSMAKSPDAGVRAEAMLTLGIEGRSECRTLLNQAI